MAECLVLKNGGGVKSDDLTVTADKVLAGYTYVGNDTDDDIGIGTGSKIYYLGQGTSFDVKAKLPNEYASLTNANFILEPINGSASGSSGENTVWGGDGGYLDGYAYTRTSTTLTKSYNATTGVLSAYQSLSCSGGESFTRGSLSTTGPFGSSGSSTVQVKAYVYLGNMA